MLRRATAAATAGLLLLTACGTDGGSAGGQEPAGIDRELIGSLSDDEAADAAASSNAFGFDLHREVSEPGANTVTSPLSASVLLAMVAAGAGGDTGDAMTDVLQLDDPGSTDVAALLAELVDTDDVALSIANALWADEGVGFEDDYLGVARDTYGATLESAPLGEQATADDIDAWVEDHTQGMIDGIAEQLGLPAPNVLLVLLNTIHFQGEWSERFDPDRTRDETFTLADGTEVEVPTMHRRLEDGELELELGAIDDHQLIRLPYGDEERFGMELLVPGDGHDLDEVLADLDVGRWQAAVDDLHPSRVRTLALPRFDLAWDAQLNEGLEALGMGPALGPGADFRPMSPADPWLGTVVQRTAITVDEAGTEAAAATGGTMAVSAPPDVRVDRPFAFSVSDRRTGAILFLGTVHDPRG